MSVVAQWPAIPFSATLGKVNSHDTIDNDNAQPAS